MTTEIPAAAVEAATAHLRRWSNCDATDDVIRSALGAALPHLTGLGPLRVTNTYLAGRFDRLEALLEDEIDAAETDAERAVMSQPIGAWFGDPWPTAGGPTGCSRSAPVVSPRE